MLYLFGDATPFPLEENFIETISAAINACVALFELDVEQAERLRQAHEVAESADRDVAQLAKLAQLLERMLAPHMPKGNSPNTAELAASQIAEHASNVIQQSRLAVLRRRDAGLRGAKQTDLGPRILSALDLFFREHQTPKTLWLFDWNAGRQAGDAELIFTVQSQGHLALAFATEVPVSSTWSGPVRLGDVDPSFELEFQHKGSWLKRGTHSGKIAIQRMFLTQVVRSPTASWFMLRQNAAKSSIGYKVVVRSQDHSGPVIFPIDAKDEMGEPLGLDDVDAVALHDLWKILKGEIKGLNQYRQRIEAASYRDKDMMEVDQPAEIAECILMSLAPLIREIRMRSRVPGELVLKRDLGDGRREELFVPRRELEKKFANLPYEQRACFSAVGLDSEATSEFLQRNDVRMMAAERSGDARSVEELRRARRLHTAGDHAS